MLVEYIDWLIDKLSFNDNLKKGFFRLLFRNLLFIFFLN